MLQYQSDANIANVTVVTPLSAVILTVIFVKHSVTLKPPSSLFKGVSKSGTVFDTVLKSVR